MEKSNIFIIEDEESIVRLLKLKFEQAGFKVFTALDGEEALKILDKDNFDLILLDIMMPKVNGIAILEHLKDQNNKTPVIVLSNLGQDEDIKKAKELGAVDYFVKSNVSLSGVIASVKKRLNIE